MATGLRYWVGATVVGCVVSAMWALPPSTPNWMARADLPEEVRYREATSALQRAHGILVANRWSDSLSALVVETAVDGLALSVPPSSLLTLHDIQEWRTQLAPWVDVGAPMTVGIVFQKDSHGTVDGVLRPRFGNRSQTYAGVRAGVPYCFVVQPERYDVGNGALRSARSLETCWLHAKYGAPGAAVEAWLDAGGYAFAFPRQVAQIGVMVGPPTEEPMPFGLRRPFSEQLSVAACLAGRADACLRAVTDPAALASRSFDARLVAQSAMSYMAAPAFSPFEVKVRSLLAEVEARFGADAFAGFWTSEQPVPTAFEAAFGVELGEWVRDWADAEVGLYRAGPAVGARGLLWALLAMMGLSAVASGTAMRRRVG